LNETNVFATDRHHPPGEWVQASISEKVAGIAYRLKDARSFANAARKAEAAQLRYGIELEPEPNNLHDPYAIKVHGFAESKNWFSKLSIRYWHIGYLPADLAEFVHSKLLNRGVTIDALLYKIYMRDTFIDVTIIVLAPPGNSMSMLNRLDRG
jgi:hypothetical protein